MDIAKMSNQERLNAFGLEESSKYHGPYERREPLRMIPALTPEGARWHSQMGIVENMEVEDDGEGAVYDFTRKMPREFIYQTQSLRNKPPKVEPEITFKKSDIKCSNRNKGRAKNGK